MGSICELCFSSRSPRSILGAISIVSTWNFNADGDNPTIDWFLKWVSWKTFSIEEGTPSKKSSPRVWQSFRMRDSVKYLLALVLQIYLSKMFMPSWVIRVWCMRVTSQRMTFWCINELWLKIGYVHIRWGILKVFHVHQEGPRDNPKVS